VLVAMEVTAGQRTAGRLIHVSLDKDKPRLVILSHRDVTLRVVDLKRHDIVEVWLAAESHTNILLLRLPCEYDLVCGGTS
jgi:hypothetical protein